MALTREDLEEILEQKLDKKLDPILKTVQFMSERFDEMTRKLDNLEKEKTEILRESHWLKSECLRLSNELNQVKMNLNLNHPLADENINMFNTHELFVEAVNIAENFRKWRSCKRCHKALTDVLSHSVVSCSSCNAVQQPSTCPSKHSLRIMFSVANETYSLVTLTDVLDTLLEQYNILNDTNTTLESAGDDIYLAVLSLPTFHVLYKKSTAVIECYILDKFRQVLLKLRVFCLSRFLHMDEHWTDNFICFQYQWVIDVEIHFLFPFPYIVRQLWTWLRRYLIIIPTSRILQMSFNTIPVTVSTVNINEHNDNFNRNPS